jgi:hypothetical protein
MNGINENKPNMMILVVERVLCDALGIVRGIVPAFMPEITDSISKIAKRNAPAVNIVEPAASSEDCVLTSLLRKSTPVANPNAEIIASNSPKPMCTNSCDVELAVELKLFPY